MLEMYCRARGLTSIHSSDNVQVTALIYPEQECVTPDLLNEGQYKLTSGKLWTCEDTQSDWHAPEVHALISEELGTQCWLPEVGLCPPPENFKSAVTQPSLVVALENSSWLSRFPVCAEP